MFRPVKPSSGEFFTKINKAIQIKTVKTVQNCCWWCHTRKQRLYCSEIVLEMEVRL